MNRLRVPDAIALISIVAIGIILLIPNVLRYRSGARRIQCENSLKKIGMAMHAYHQTYKRLPTGAGGTDPGSVDDPYLGNGLRLSAFVGILPFIDEGELWKSIRLPLRRPNGRIGSGGNLPSMGPMPWVDPKEYPPWGKRPDVFVCADDPDSKRFPYSSSYSLSYGDSILNIGANFQPDDPRGRCVQRGVFMRGRWIRFREILDGTSNTILLSEMKFGGDAVAKVEQDFAMNPSLIFDTSSHRGKWPEGRKSRWCDGTICSSGFQTVLPPNSPSATDVDDEFTALMSASSHHAGGVYVLCADGAVMFISNQIDAGDASNPSVAIDPENKLAYAPLNSKSPYGVWGALGSRGYGELVESFDPNIKKIDVKPIPPDMKLSSSMRDWQLVDGEKFRGQFKGVVERQKVEILLKSGSLRTVRLSELNSQDAFYAVEQNVAQLELLKSLAQLHLQEGLLFLKAERYDGFIARLVDPESKIFQSDNPPKIIEERKQWYIQKLQLSLLLLKNGDAELSGDGRSMHVKVSVRASEFYFDGERWRWKL